jgi:glycosyltransferase involved in cell wall biosynthesis
MSPEKRVDRAIEIACRAGMRLTIAAKIYPEERAYFQQTIEPLLQPARPGVEFLGEVGGREKDEFLGNAFALLFPIDWPEPFGLVMIESLACGTPVIAWRNGSVPEVVTDGVTGFVVDGIEEAVRAVGRVAGLSRRACRDEFERRFDAARMAQNYLAVYRALVQGNTESERPAPAAAPVPPFQARSADRRRSFRPPAPLLSILSRSE